MLILSFTGLDPAACRVFEGQYGTRDSQQGGQAITEGGGDLDDWEDVPDPEDPTASITYAIRDITACSSHRISKDTRTWRQHLQKFDENWPPLLPLLTDAFLRFQYGLPPGVDEALPDANADSMDAEETINALDLYTLDTMTTFNIRPDERKAEALMHTGYIGNAPLVPSVAVSIETLELFRSIRLVKVSMSVDTFTKLLCHYYTIPYCQHYRNVLAAAFDIYLLVLQIVDERVMKEFGWDSPEWRAINGCPPCAYELEDEEPSTFARMLCMDGNNSLKRIAPTDRWQVGDNHIFNSDYILPRDWVDQFAHEVKARQVPSKPAVPTESDHEGDDNEADQLRSCKGDLTDGQGLEATPCATNWKAASSEETKRMWGMFEERGIFGCACQHGIILWIADMVRSGELAKYGIAVVAKILCMIRCKVLLGYNIGCAFEETVKRSSLGPEFVASGSRFCVNAFHGYSHSYQCQVQHHPNSITGIGIEDLETMERIFSGSNKLAPVTRYASAYCRHLLIDLYYRQWDHEKYSNIGLMLHNNYRQALDIIKQAPVLETMLNELGMTLEQMRTFEGEEREYFVNLRDEDPANLHAIVYVEALQKLEAAKKELGEATERFGRTAPRAPSPSADHDTQVQWLLPHTGLITSYDAERSTTAKMETRIRQLHDRINRRESEVCAIEASLGIENRWQRNDYLYTETLQYINTHRYQRALHKLQRLVVLRLFELHKLNIARTGYKVRTYLAKSFQRRCRAIRNAVDQYNTAARALHPLRADVNWDQVSHYTFVQEFSLLQDSSNDVSQKAWSRPEVRKTMRLVRRIERAREELTNDNCEARRMHTWIRDEELLFASVLQRLHNGHGPLYGAVAEYCRQRRAANARNMAYLQQLYSLEGFTGDPTPGRRVGSDALPHPMGTDPTIPSGPGASEENEDGLHLQENEEAHGEVSAIIEYLASLTT
ncbi:hypothetical protein C8Q80DRAFT_1222084 [Daedaleopsis nitida]|nr:hypothetical protein C8Q80DRAFT_1222084 [Daedaleopsis nitida]